MLLLLLAALCLALDVQRTTYAAIKDDPFEKIMVFCRAGACSQIEGIIAEYSGFVNWAFGAQTYEIDADEEPEDVLAVLNLASGESAVYVKDKENTTFKFHGNLSPATDEEAREVARDFGLFTELRFARPGPLYLLPYDKMGLEMLLDFNRDATPVLLVVFGTRLEERLAELYGTRFKDRLRILALDLAARTDELNLSPIYELGPSLVFFGQRDLHDKSLSAHVHPFPARYDDVALTKWLEALIAGEDVEGAVVELPLDEVERRDIARCLPDCGGPRPAPRTLEAMAEAISERIEKCKERLTQ